jgi:aspartate racemase
MKKPIGIIGGMGPEASILMSQMIFEERGPVECDQDHIPFIHFSASYIPDRSAFLTKVSSNDPLPEMLKVVHSLSPLCSVLLLPCNTAHHWFQELQEISQIPILHMVNTTVKVVKEHAVIISTLGSKQQGIYDCMFESQGKVLEYPPDMEAVQSAITLIKAQDYAQASQRLDSVLEPYRREGVSLVFGCTEFSVLFRENPKLFEEITVLDPMRIVVREAIKLYET